MDIRSVFAPSCTFPSYKSFHQDFEFQSCLHLEKAATDSRRLSAKCCLRPVCGGVSTESVEDSTLVDVQESSDGFVLFKFGTTQLYDNPSRFVSSGAHRTSPVYVEGNRELIDCPTTIYRFPDENLTEETYPWGYNSNTCLDVSPSIAFPIENSSDVPRPIINSEELPDVPGVVGPLSFVDQIPSSEPKDEAFVRYLQSSNFTSSASKQLPSNISLKGVTAEAISLGSEVVQAMKSTAPRVDRVGKRTKIRHKKPVRDLYRGSSFQVYELIFRYPFMDTSKSISSLKAIPKERYTELVVVINQIAIGLAGGGLALVLFVASRMLCLDATLDGIKLMSLVRGLGLLWLSSAMQKFGSVIKLMAECAEKARLERKVQLAMLRREVHSVTFKVCTMVMLSMVRLA